MNFLVYKRFLRENWNYSLKLLEDHKKVYASNRTVSGTHECIKQMNLGAPYDFKTASTVVDEASPLETKVGLSGNADIRCTDLRFNRDGTQLFV